LKSKLKEVKRIGAGRHFGDVGIFDFSYLKVFYKFYSLQTIKKHYWVLQLQKEM